MIVIKKPDQETIEKFVELGGIAKMTGDYNLFCKEFPNQGTTAEEIITSFKLYIEKDSQVKADYVRAMVDHITPAFDLTAQFISSEDSVENKMIYLKMHEILGVLTIADCFPESYLGRISDSGN